MHFFIHNSYHSGDVIFTRPIITALKERYPDLQMTLECRDYNVYLWEDFGFPIITYVGGDHNWVTPTSNCPPGVYFMNLWFGAFTDILLQDWLTYKCTVNTFNRYMAHYHLQHLFHLPIPDVTPAIEYCRKSSIIPINKNSIFVENGQVRAGQSNFPMNECLSQLVNAFPQFTFYCSAKPLCNAPNLVDCSHYNLIQLSEVSNQCQALLAVGSGVNASTYTEENRLKPRCLAGMIYRNVIWDNSHTCYADDFNAVFDFVGRLPYDKWAKLKQLLPKKV